MDEDKRAQILRYRDTISIVGTGVIAFGAWSTVRIIMYIVLSANDYLKQYGSTVLTIATIILCGIAFVDLVLRIYVGLSARAEGKGARKGSFYLVCAGLLVLGLALSIGFALYSIITEQSLDYAFDLVVSTIIDATSLITIVQLIVSAVRLRKLDATGE